MTSPSRGEGGRIYNLSTVINDNPKSVNLNSGFSEQAYIELEKNLFKLAIFMYNWSYITGGL